MILDYLNLLPRVLFRTRRTGSTTACIRGLESVGGGVLIVINGSSTPANLPENIEVISLSQISKLVGRTPDKPILIDPSALAYLLKQINAEHESLLKEVEGCITVLDRASELKEFRKRISLLLKR